MIGEALQWSGGGFQTMKLGVLMVGDDRFKLGVLMEVGVLC